MHAVYFDAPCSDDERRGRLYNGQLFLFSPRPSVTALREFARRMVEEAFAPLDPRTAQFHMASISSVPSTSGCTTTGSDWTLKGSAASATEARAFTA